VKLRHTKLSIPTQDTWLIARMAHAPDVRGLALVLQTSSAGREFETLASAALQKAGYATLALDLLSNEERDDPDAHYNIANLSGRAQAVLEWVRYQPDLAVLPLGAFASQTAAAAAIRAAARFPGRIGALGILAGRPDLAGAAPLRSLKTPTCFIVGESDLRTEILRQAFDLITTAHDWRRVDGCCDSGQMTATVITACASAAADWMRVHLPVPSENKDPVFSPLVSALFFADVTPFSSPPEK
jgi:hypothetical protein